MKLTNAHVGETAYVKSGEHGGRSGKIIQIYEMQGEIIATLALSCERFPSRFPNSENGAMALVDFSESMLEFDAPKKPKFIVVDDPYTAPRRERIATAALQGMLGGALLKNLKGEAITYGQLAHESTLFADALIAELDKGDADAPTIT